MMLVSIEPSARRGVDYAKRLDILSHQYLRTFARVEYPMKSKALDVGFRALALTEVGPPA